MNDIGKNKLAMVDFWSVCDEKGNPVGHGSKVGREYYNIIKEFFSIKQYVNADLVRWIDTERVVPLFFKHKSNENKFLRILRGGLNIYSVYKKEKNIWFYVPDIYLFLFILLIPKRKHKIIVNVYEIYSNSVLKHFIFKLALTKIDLAIVTNQKILAEFSRRILIQDYYYDKVKYMKYPCDNKKDCCVCLGTMNGKKRLFELVDVFSKNGYQLFIIGQFTDKELFKTITGKKSSNIVIEDKYLEDDEYYSLLASSKFCVIPYDTEFYKNRTSGVIQESIFLNTIPIAPKEILEFTEIPGVGYDDIQDLESIDLHSVQFDTISETYEKLVTEKYDVSRIKKTIINGINNVLYINKC